MWTMSEEQITNEKTGAHKRVGRIALLLCAILFLTGAVFMVLSCYQASVCTVIYPNTLVNGIPVGGLSFAQAEELLQRELQDKYAGKALDLILPNGQTMSISADLAGAGPDMEAAAEAAYSRGRERSTVGAGAVYLISHLFKSNISAEYALKQEDYVLSVISEAAGQVDQRLRQTVCRVTTAELMITKGITGLTVNQDALYQQVADALSNADFSPISVSPEVTHFSEPNLSAIWLKLHTTPEDAYFDKEARAITPHTAGVSFDLSLGERTLKQAAEGSVVTIPLIFTDPEMTTAKLESILFRDVLGSCKSEVGGTENRVSNVTLAASFANDTILLPGDIFSYNGIVGSRTLERGFLPAPAYVGGQTVDEVGGGICQVSSAAYLAALRANLHIVERHPHMYAVGYLPDGMDATVYFGSLDFSFENNTAYPIRIVTLMSNRLLSIKIYGTKTDDSYVKMENKQVSFNQYETVYQADDTIALGEEKVDVTGYSGRKVEVYRCLYSGDGTLISRTFESVNNYKRRNKVVLVNPEDPRLAVAAGEMEADSVAAATTGEIPLD